jgi:hypothetical protein
VPLQSQPHSLNEIPGFRHKGMEEGGCSKAFGYAAKQLEALAEQENAPTAPAIEEPLARWTRLPYRGEEHLELRHKGLRDGGALSCVFFLVRALGGVGQVSVRTLADSLQPTTCWDRRRWKRCDAARTK